MNDQSPTPLPPNPYESPVLAEVAGEALPGLPEVAAVPSAQPHPNLGLAIVWTLGLFGVQVVFGLVLGVAALVYAQAAGQKSMSQMLSVAEDWSVASIPYATFLTVAVAVVVARFMLGRDFLRLLAARYVPSLSMVWVVLLVLPLAFVTGEICNGAAEVLPSLNGAIFDKVSRLPFLVVFLGGCLFPAVGEELFFRGFLGRGVVGNHGRLVGVLCVSFLFGAIHFDPVQSIGAFVLGLMLHYVYLTTRSLTACIVLHLLNNLLAFVLMRYSDAFLLEGISTNPGETVLHASPFVVAASIGPLPVLMLLLHQTRTCWILPNGSPWSPGYVSTEQPPAEAGARAQAAAPRPLAVALLVVTYGLFLWATLREVQWN